MFCFTNILTVIFSFHLSLAPCIKTHKTQEMALKRLYFSKFSWGPSPRTPLEVLAPKARVGQIRVRPLKISKRVRLCYLCLLKVVDKICCLLLLSNLYNRPQISFYNAMLILCNLSLINIVRFFYLKAIYAL